MDRILQAGAILARRAGGAPKVLLVRARRNPEHWIFPKGHIEPGESAAHAAARELREETGLEGDVVAPIGALEFRGPRGMLNVQYFLLRYVGERDAGEGREMQWCGMDEALERLSFDDARALLERARPLIEAHIR